MTKAVRTPRGRALHLTAHAVLLVGGLLLIYPLVFMLLGALFTKEEFAGTAIGLFPIPDNPVWQNYGVLVFSSFDKTLQTYYVNTFLRTFYGTFWAVLTALLAGYVFARLRFKGRDTLFMFLLTTQMIPGIIALLPLYMELVKFPFGGEQGIYNTVWVYVLLNGGAINILGMFLVKQALESVPFEIDEAAKMDGAGTARLIFRILMPLIKPVLAFIAITTSIGIWNDWTVPFFFINDANLLTMTAGLAKATSFAGSLDIPNYPLMLTMSLALTVPCLILFFMFQKLIVQGLANTGVKG